MAQDPTRRPSGKVFDDRAFESALQENASRFRLSEQEIALLQMIANINRSAIPANISTSAFTFGPTREEGNFLHGEDKMTLFPSRFFPSVKSAGKPFLGSGGPMSARDSAFVMAHEFGHKFFPEISEGEASIIGDLLLRVLSGQIDPRRDSADMNAWNLILPAIRGR